MNKQAAIRNGKRIAKKKNEIVYVVYTHVEYSMDYDWATEYDMDTFYQGETPILAIMPDGTIEANLMLSTLILTVLAILTPAFIILAVEWLSIIINKTEG